MLVRAAGNVGFELVLNSFARFPDEHPELVAKLYDRRHEADEEGREELGAHRRSSATGASRVAVRR